VKSNFGVTPSDLAAECHGDDHTEDDDDRGSDTDADDAQLVVIQLFVEPGHEPLVASSRPGLRFRLRGDGGIAGGGGRRGDCGYLLATAIGYRFISGLRKFAAFEGLLDVVQALSGVCVGFIILLQFCQTLFDDFSELILVSVGHDRASNHEDKDEQLGEEEETQEALVLLRRAAAAEETDDHDADADDDEQDGSLVDRSGELI